MGEYAEGEPLGGGHTCDYFHKGSSQQVADATRTLAQGKIQLNVKGAERRGRRFGSTSDWIMSRATCAELIALCCAVCLLAMSGSDWQCTGVTCEEKNVRTERRQSNESNQSSTHVHTGTWYTVLRMTPASVHSQESTTKHGTTPFHVAGQRTSHSRAPHDAALR